MKAITWATNLYKKAVGTTDTAPKPSAEEMKEVIDAALDFDKIVVMPGFERCCKFLVAEVNREISEATQFKYEPDRQRVHVIRWDAKRELIDGMMGYINGMQRSRDEIVNQFRRGDERDVNDPNGN